MSDPQPTRRASRWTRDPILDSSGAEIIVRPTERDVEVLKLLARFRFLPADYIHAFMGGNAKALSRRLNLLSRKPNLYLARPHQQRDSHAANHRPLIYELDARGCRLLRERDIATEPPASRRNFTHELMVAEITASIELGARSARNVTLISWLEILANKRTPISTRQSAAASIRVTYSLNSQQQTTEISADAAPFGLRRLVGDSSTYLFFPGIEADCATEPISSRDAERSSIARKFAAYSAVAEQGLYRSHFGFPNFFIPFLTTNAARMNSMMQLLDRITAGRGSKIFLFKTFPPFTSTGPALPPNGAMLSEPWQRVGFPSLYLDR